MTERSEIFLPELNIIELDTEGSFADYYSVLAADSNFEPTWIHTIKGVQISKDNTKVYFNVSAALEDPTGGIFCYDFDTQELSNVIYDEYNFTFLQADANGFIYAVSNDGDDIGKIDPTTNTIAVDYLDIDIYSTIEAGGMFIYALPDLLDYNSVLTLEISATYESCAGMEDGTATVNVSGGVPPYTYQWDDPTNQTTQTAVNLSPGIYMCTVTDAFNTSLSISAEVVTDPDLFTHIGNWEVYTLDGIENFAAVDGTIEIFNGGTFMIDATVEFNSNSGIIIHDGGTLILENNCILSGLAACDNNTWDGIIIEEQGIFIIYNVTTISKGDITFESGSQISLNYNAIYLEDNNIIIKPGRELVLDHTSLKAIIGKTWKGIEVWGDSQDNQFVYYGHPLAQGKLALYNSTIEHAKLAVLLAATDEQGEIIYSKTGGIVTARNSHFINNTKSLYALYYQNTDPNYPGSEIGNFSYFKNTTFTINNNYIFEDDVFYKHIDLTHVKGFNFEGCDFLNTASEAVVSSYNCGIMAFDAGFSVEGLCTSYTYPCPEDDYDRSNLSGFYSAVWASSDGSTINTFSVDHSNFTDNAIGVKASSVNNAVIIYSDFNIGYNSNPDAKEECGDRAISYGIDMLSSHSFAIEENEFTTSQTSGEYYGVRILSSNTVYDLIYNNTYNNLTQANRAEGDNRDDSDDDNGLEYQCNINTNNEIDFIVANFVGIDAQIKTRMGNNTLASGNTFTDNINAMHFINEGTQNINYYWCELSSCEFEEPLYYNTDIYFQPIDVSTSNSCPSHYGGGGIEVKLSDVQRTQKELDFSDNLNDYNSVLSLYESLEDGGNTTSELLDIATAQPADMWELRSQLLGHSPYLSHEVLKEAADKTDVLPDGVLFEILSANPDELRNTDLIEYLENKEEPLPDYMISILQQMAGGITAKTVIKMEMGRSFTAKTMAAYDIIRSILNDSTYDAADLRGWLGNLQSYNADRQIISSWLQEGNTADAVNLLNMLPALYELEGDALEAYNDYVQIINLQVSLQNEGRNIMQLNSNELDELADLAENGLGTARQSARNILQYAYEHQYYDCPCDNDTTTKSAHVKLPPNMVADALQIEAYPSPAGTWVTFDYVLPLNETEALITISDVNGKTIKRISLSAARGQKVVEVRNIHNGIWFYTLHSGVQTKSGKLVIQH